MSDASGDGAGFAGTFCQGTLKTLTNTIQASGFVTPGDMTYYSLNNVDVQKALEIDFYADGGQSVVLGSFTCYPNLTTNNFVFR